MYIKPEKITQINFKRFGYVIECPKAGKSKTKNLWRVIVRQPNTGWRIACLVVRDKTIFRLEQHPGSLESFEPVSGKAFLYVSAKKDETDIRCFLLDKPIILKKGIWHGVVALKKECDIKITENLKVRCVYWKLRAGLPYGRS